MLDYFDGTQKNLNILQAIPFVGPAVFSPIKVLVSKAHVITGIALGIFFEIKAIAASGNRHSGIVKNHENVAKEYFNMALNGGLNWLYACANFSTFGILGLGVELSRRNVTAVQIH